MAGIFDSSRFDRYQKVKIPKGYYGKPPKGGYGYGKAAAIRKMHGKKRKPGKASGLERGPDPLR